MRLLPRHSNDRLRVWVNGIHGAKAGGAGAAAKTAQLHAKVGELDALGVDLLAPACLGGGGESSGLLDVGVWVHVCMCVCSPGLPCAHRTQAQARLRPHAPRRVLEQLRPH